ncbi:metal-dependent hydrolase [Chordicoccus furentiruminis]|uniref:metal-dependent hydrolase n=1 Tax=Chordicoccus furentiruminis TaxID=2709410 RepID=UPI0023A892CE|nr:metal-dependent hydrolase [Chordicoccus furentiruminis]
MQGKTHLVIGVALSLAVMRPATMPALVSGAGAAALGSVISDIDAGQSGAGHDATKVVASIVIAGVLVLLADLYFHLGLYARFLRRGRETGFMLPLLLFILFAAVGMLTRHRSFMHSLPAMILFTACIWFMQRAMTPYFAIAYASHLLLDLTNRRGMRLFFPSRKLVSMKLFASNGWMDRILLTAGVIALVLVVAHSAPMTGQIARLRGMEAAVKSRLAGLIP